MIIGNSACGTAMALSLMALAGQAYGQEQSLSPGTEAAQPAAEVPASTVGTIPVAVAQEPETEEASPPAFKNRFVEEVVVTAQKREENVQDVPISISAFSGEALSAKGIATAADLPLATPGLTYTVFTGYSVIYLRGVGTDAFIPSTDQSVATYVDGIYLPFGSGLAQAFGAVERIEVLKGPQGTLFGRNSTGGAISVVTKNPGPVAETSIESSYSKFDTFNNRVYTSIPLGDRLAVSLSGVYNTTDNYYTNRIQPIGGDETKAARVKLKWSPLDNLDINLAALKSKTEGPLLSVASQFAPKPILQALGVEPSKDYEASYDSPTFNKVKTEIYYGGFNWSLPRLDVKLLASHQKGDTRGQLDFDGSAFPLVSFSQHAISKVETAELQLISNQESWGADWLRYIGGLYYLKSAGGFDPVGLFAGLSDPSILVGRDASAQAAYAVAVAPVLNRLNSLLPTPLTPVTLNISGIVDTKAYAAFFQTTADLTDEFSLTLGARYQTEKRSLRPLPVELPDPSLPPLVTYAARSKDNDDLSPKVSLEFRPFDDVLGYLSATQGFKSGTYNITTIYTQPQYIKPEQVTAYEAGVKSTLFDGALRLNAALFQTTIKDIQVQIVSLAAGGAVNFENAGSARIRGAEGDISWLPLPNSLPGAVLSANATYLDSEYTDYDEGSGFDETTGVFFGKNSLVLPGRDFSGNRVVQTPKFSATVSPSYSFELENGSIEVASDVYFNSGFFYTAQNSDRSNQPAYHLINARVSYLYSPWNLRVTAFAKNLNNAKYYFFQFDTDFGTSGVLQPPAVYGLKVNWDF